MWNRIWLYVYFTWFHPMLKWVLRRATGKCELLRICCNSYTKTGHKTKDIENALKTSKLRTFQRMVVDDDLNISEAIKYTMSIKDISPKIYPEFFAENYNGEARQTLIHSQHPTLWYSYAIVGINLTSLVYDLLKDGLLREHFYYTITGEPAIYHFHRIYCQVFTEFDRFWFAEKPKSVMEFGSVRDKFEKKVVGLLMKNDNAILHNNYTGMS